MRERIQKALHEVPARERGVHVAAEELDRLVRLGELARVRAPGADAATTDRALRLAAPTLMEATSPVAS